MSKKMKIGDKVKYRYESDSPSAWDIGILGAIEGEYYYVFQNKRNGTMPSLVKPSSRGFNYSFEVGKEDVEKIEEDKMESFKQYLEKHRDAFFTIGIVLLLDHFVFSGAFREKLKQMVDSILDRNTKAITDGK